MEFRRLVAALVATAGVIASAATLAVATPSGLNATTRRLHADAISGRYILETTFEPRINVGANPGPYGNRCAIKPRYRGFPTGQQGSGRVLVGSLGPDSARWLLGCLHEF